MNTKTQVNLIEANFKEEGELVKPVDPHSREPMKCPECHDDDIEADGLQFEYWKPVESDGGAE